MNLSELMRAVRQALATGKVGTPVSVKVWVPVAAPAETACDRLVPLIERFVPLLDDPAETLLAQISEGDDHGQALVTTVHGRTALIATGRAAASDAAIQFLLVGNRGIVQLGGQLEWEADPNAESSDSARWKDALQASCRQQRRVEISRCEIVSQPAKPGPADIP